MNPKKEKYHESEEVKIPLPFSFMYNKKIVCNILPLPQSMDSQNVKTWLFHAFNFMLTDREIKSDQTM